MSITVKVNQENKAVFVCPECGNARTIDVTKFVKVKSNAKIKAKCPCGNRYSVVLERRKFYRKETKLPGRYTADDAASGWPMTVTNISRTGLEFRTSNARNLKEGDRLGVEFRLDNNKRSLIKKKVIIRKIKEQFVGTEFLFLDEYDKVLGFYLFN